ncbi:MAG: DUF1570 domain-containing protein [Planctomycetota bacterium]
MPQFVLPQKFWALAWVTVAICVLATQAAPAVPPVLEGVVATPQEATESDKTGDGDEEEKKEKVEIPPPPADNLSLPDSIEPDVKERFVAAMKLYAEARRRYTKEEPRKDAIRAFKKLQRKMNATSALPGYYLGILYQWDRDYPKARRELKKVIKAAPEFYEAYVELADVDVWQRKREDAIPRYEAALDIYPHYEYGVDRILMVLVELGRFEDARPYLERALSRGTNPMREQCRQAIEFATKDPDWGETFVVESENYIIKTNVSQASAQEFSETVELVRELYDGVFPDIAKPDRKYLIMIFGDRESYVRAGAPANSGGVYWPLARRIMLFKKPDMAKTLITLKHEGFHQYCHEYLDNIPSWFNEGLADYFSASQLVKKGNRRVMKIRPAADRLKFMITILNRKIPRPTVAELMNMSQAEMYDMRNKNKRMYQHYCQAWAVVYFCIEGGNRKYQKALKEYFKSIRKGKTGAEAYRVTFGRLNMNKFEEEWQSFMQRTYSTDKGI